MKQDEVNLEHKYYLDKNGKWVYVIDIIDVEFSDKKEIQSKNNIKPIKNIKAVVYMNEDDKNIKTLEIKSFAKKHQIDEFEEFNGFR
mgnify:CR=1 FL=1